MVLILSLTHTNNTGILAYLRFKEREVVHLHFNYSMCMFCRILGPAAQSNLRIGLVM
jgi:hypothetical protein